MSGSADYLLSTESGDRRSSLQDISPMASATLAKIYPHPVPKPFEDEFHHRNLETQYRIQEISAVIYMFGHLDSIAP